MSVKKVGVLGASGKVGKEINIILKEKGLIPFLGIYSNNKPQDYLNIAQDITAELAGQVDLWIDFSLPESFEKFIPKIAKYNKPIVSGTTGITEQQKTLLTQAAKTCPVLWSSNMSLGIAVLTEAMEAFKKIKHFDFQIEELHHIRKKDAPSGTAITLQQKLTNVIEKEIPAPLAIRGGGIFGIHKVWAMSEQEVITIEHQALNRRVFAEGAVFAGLKLAGRPAGLYGMKDVL
jgi:4-hydroxy-tetrahydrodipicolinate reductase